MARAEAHPIAYAQYLALDAASENGVEFHDGAVRAMAGATIAHGRILANVLHLLRVGLGERRCAVLAAGTKVRVEATNRTLLPDAAVVCGAIERSGVDADAVTNPIVIVEVLSPSTADYDLGTKFRHYRWLPSLREYVAVSQDDELVEVWRRDAGWALEESRQGGVARLTSLGVELALADVYRDPLAHA
ncbi:MAG TPA: Uma2 family endonuclease [Byssovorax sp.]|jgi:Uma2 family endonuclease